MTYDEYKAEIVSDIKSCMDALQVQPILFMGSGISQRYFGAPDWNGLMRTLAEGCPLIKKPYPYYQQRYKNDNTEIATCFSESYSEWAWEQGQDNYPSHYFEENSSQDIYIKHYVCKHIEGLSETFTDTGHPLENEFRQLKKINPHAIITTNYDDLMEKLFPDYFKIVGQEVVRANYTNYGDILKIHGCSKDPESIILTHEDYHNFNKKKKYLSAKLLTYFAEHPLFFFGYSLTDENIKGILSDIDEILAPNNELIPNIYMVCFDKSCIQKENNPKEQLIVIDENRSVRLKVIMAEDFEWIYSALAECTPEITVNPKLIRTLLSRTYKLASSELPRQELPFNFKMLQEIADNDDKLSTLYGVTEISNPQSINASFIYTITNLAEMMGISGWYQVDCLISRITKDKGINIKDSDNIYHINIKTGHKSNGVRKYSNNALELLKKVQANEPYGVHI